MLSKQLVKTAEHNISHKVLLRSIELLSWMSFSTPDRPGKKRQTDMSEPDKCLALYT